MKRLTDIFTGFIIGCWFVVAMVFKGVRIANYIGGTV